ncbi:MAG: tetratricopeptide repeat protein [Terricaulis silvestris]
MADVSQLIQDALATFRANDVAGAERALQEGRRVAPGNSEIVRCQAWIMTRTGRAEAALPLLEEAERLDPQSALAPLDRGNVLFELRRYEDAIAAFAEVLRRDPRNADAHFNRARALMLLERQAESVAGFDAGLDLREDASALHQRGLLRHAMGQPDLALADFEHALRLRPDDPAIAIDRGAALSELGRRREALAVFDAVLARQPQHPDARRHRAKTLYNEAMDRLAAGDFAEGFRLYEARREANAIETPPYARGQREWRGEKLAGVLHVWSEQGLGEELAFASLLPLAAERTPRVALECDMRLVPLFRRSFPMLERVQGDNAPIADIEAQCALPSLPHAMALSESAPRGKYLQEDQARSARLRARYRERAAGKPIIGVAWFSNNKTIGAGKSAPLSDWGALLRQPVLFVNLQYGNHDAEVAAACAQFGCDILTDPEIDQLKDVDAFAAQVAAMDAVVSVSNSTVHMAGALGVRCLVLAPAPPALLWFWGREGGDTLWYDSVKAVRRAAGEGWPEQIARAAGKLKDWA